MDQYNLTSGYTHKRMKAWPQLDICTLMFTVALFTIAKRCEQPRTASNTHWGKYKPSINGVRKTVYLHAEEGN